MSVDERLRRSFQQWLGDADNAVDLELALRLVQRHGALPSPRRSALVPLAIAGCVLGGLFLTAVVGLMLFSVGSSSSVDLEDDLAGGYYPVPTTAYRGPPGASIVPDGEAGPPMTVGDYSLLCPAFVSLSELEGDRMAIQSGGPVAVSEGNFRRDSLLDEIERTLFVVTPEVADALAFLRGSPFTDAFDPDVTLVEGTSWALPALGAHIDWSCRQNKASVSPTTGG